MDETSGESRAKASAGRKRYSRSLPKDPVTRACEIILYEFIRATRIHVFSLIFVSKYLSRIEFSFSLLQRLNADMISRSFKKISLDRSRLKQVVKINEICRGCM